MDQGPWARLEQAARNLALQDGVEAVYGMTALLYERPMPQLLLADEPHLRDVAAEPLHHCPPIISFVNTLATTGGTFNSAALQGTDQEGFVNGVASGD